MDANVVLPAPFLPNILVTSPLYSVNNQQTIHESHSNPTSFMDSKFVIYGKIFIQNNNDIDNELKNKFIHDLIANIYGTHEFVTGIYTNITNDDEINALNYNNIDTSIYGLIINNIDFDNNIFDYTLRLSSETVPSTSSTNNNNNINNNNDILSIPELNTYSVAFIPFQRYLDEYFINYLNNTNSDTKIEKFYHKSKTSIHYQSFWHESYTENGYLNFLDNIGGLLPFYIVNCFLLPFSYLIKDVVEEKSEKIKEGMSIMGLNVCDISVHIY